MPSSFSTSETPPPVLYQFRLSMYPEKARWALYYKGLAHVRRNLLPGPHIPFMMKRFGQKAMPVLQAGDTLLKDSNSILQWLESQYPEPALFPADADERREVDALIDRYDDWGVHVRRALFFDLLADADYAGQAFGQGVTGWKHRAYRMAFMATRIAMKKDMNITAATAEQSRERVREALDYTADRTAGTGYLVGNSFTAADLTAATCLHCVCAPPEYPAVFRETKSARHQAFLELWTEHPASHWVQAIYRQHRGHSSATLEID